MDRPEQALLQQVTALVEREHSLRARLAEQRDAERINERAALHRLEDELDQCWDLLRQRRALRAAGLAEQSAQVRSVTQVQNYLPRPGGPR